MGGVMTIYARNGARRSYHVVLDAVGFWSMVGVSDVPGIAFLALGIALVSSYESSGNE